MISTALLARRRLLQAARFATILVLALPLLAQARTETLRWSHPTPADVDGFRVHYGTSSGSYPTTIEVGRPGDDGQGNFSYPIQVADDATVYVVTTAFGAGFLDSDFSNEKVLPAPSGSPPPPPPAGAIWSDDFQTSATGTNIPGWIDTGADNSLSENDALFAIADVQGNRVISTSSTLTNIHSHFVASSSNAWANYEFSGRLQITDPAGGIGVTAYSKYTQSDVYYRLRHFGTGAFEISPHGASVTCSQPSTGVVPSANTWYRFRLEVGDAIGANSVRARVWRDGTAEPTTWQATCLDASSTRPTTGRVGLWSMGTGTKRFDDLAVRPIGGGGTGSLPPVPPPPILFAP